MGYEFHITRKPQWSDENGPVITLAEWQQLIERDPELSLPAVANDENGQQAASYGDDEESLWWNEGEITSKNPSQLLITKMAAIAATLGAQVQGDDGEVYGADGKAQQEKGFEAAESRGFLTRIKGWLGRRRNTKASQQHATAFTVGQRVRDSFGRRGTVTDVDPGAEHCVGKLHVRFEDGNESCYALIAPGVEPDEPSPGAT